MSTKTNIYQMHIRQYLSYHGVKYIEDLPLQLFEDLKLDGFECVWIMGIWQLPSIDICLKYIGLEQLDYYKKINPDFSIDDLCGSIFAIDKYEIDANLTQSNDAFLQFKEKINKLGLKLILDFIPNHFHIESSTVANHPNIFVNWTDQQNNLFLNDLYSHNKNNHFYIANGKDPHFPAWKDTAQLNWLNSETADFMISQLNYISQFCDGVRCDMAMLILNKIFEKNWELYDKYMCNTYKVCLPQFRIEVWKTMISSIKSKNPNFFFIAECYWETQLELINCGFDYVYYKNWLDFVNSNPRLSDIDGFLNSTNELLNGKGVIFIENHDEERAKNIFNSDTNYQIVKNITKALPFSYLENWGQEEGFKYNFPVQLKNTHNKSS